MIRGEEDCPVTRRVAARPRHTMGWLLGILAAICWVATFIIPDSLGVTAQDAADSPLASPETSTAITSEQPVTATITSDVFEIAQATFTPSLAPPTPARILITELMVAPRVVGEEAGEWIELTNLDAAPVNLRDWTIMRPSGQTHLIRADVWINPGAQVVLRATVIRQGMAE